jgi:DNA helicase HerA-like ATPase
MRAAAADEIVASLAQHAIDMRIEEPHDALEVVRASFLVENRKVRGLERAAEALAARHQRITFDLVGPMPPHSFVSLTPQQRG